MNKLIGRKVFMAVMGVAVTGVLLCGTTSFAGEIIAQWTFDDVNTPWAESSGNGPNLTNVGAVTQSSTVMTGETGYSAYFDGSTNSILETVSALDLSSYRSIQISWLQLLQTDDQSLVFEHSSNMNNTPGGFYWLINQPNLDANGGVGFFGINNDADPHNTSRMNMPKAAHNHGATNTTWEAMVVQIDLDAESNDGVTSIYRNGTLVSTYNFTPIYGLTTTAGDAPAALLNDVLYLGGRDGGVIPFVGHLDNFTITAVPEPGTIILLLSMVGSFFVWKRMR